MEKKVSHSDRIDQRISKLPQFIHLEQLIDCLNKTKSDLTHLKTQLNNNLNDIKYEIVVESQRGTTISGNHIYSKESIIYPLDPPKFQTVWGDKVSSLNHYPDPGLNWRWGWDRWHILEIDDVDENGWAYSSVRFGSKHWKGMGGFLKFVRRRIWVRLSESIDPVNDSEETDDDLEGKHVLYVGNKYEEKSSKLDFFKRYLSSTSPPVVIEPVSNNQIIGNTKKISKNEVSERGSIYSALNSKHSLDDLIGSIAKFEIDRLKTERLLHFLFNAATVELDHILDHLDFIDKILDLFIFNDSKLNFLNKFQSRIENLPETEGHEALLLHKILDQFQLKIHHQQ